MPTPDDLQFKKLVLANSLATHDQVEECVEALTTYEQAGIIKPLSSVMLDKGYLTIKQVNAVRQLQGKDEECVIRGYTILETLGQGGLGVVYKARQDSIGRTVALKVMFPNLVSNKEYVQRFMREAKVSAELDHPNIVRGIDFGEAEGYYFFAMEYVNGGSLKEIIKEKGIFDEQEAVLVILKIADALKYAENRNLIHRDIKPENIMLTKDGIPKLCDLGLAKTLESTDMSLTRTGIIMGTPHYISPEQAVGQKDLDIRSDIYSLGITLYHMITGDVPYQGTTVISIISQHISGKIPSPREKNPGVSDDLCQIISTMMAKKRDERYQAAQELIVDLKRFLRHEPLIGTQGNCSNSGLANNLVNEMGGLLAQIDEEQSAPSSATTKLAKPPTKKVAAHDSQSGKMVEFIDAATIDLQEEISVETNLGLVREASFAGNQPQPEFSSPELNHTEPLESHRLVQDLEQRVYETASSRKRPGRGIIVHFLLICLLGTIAAAGYLNKGKISAYFVPNQKRDVPLVLGIEPYQKGDHARASKKKYMEELQQLKPLASEPAHLQKDMVKIEGGSYWHTEETGQRRQVTVASFWLDRYEVSNLQYHEFCRQTGRTFPLTQYSKKLPPELASLPVADVCYYDACMYARWRGKRLPSEQEWEYAVASSKQSAYPWGPHYQEGRANIGTGKIASVQSYFTGRTTAEVFNLAGNVWEWTSTFYGEFKENYVIKGGSFAYSAEYAQFNYRDAFFPYGSRNDIGFRCALDTHPVQKQENNKVNDRRNQQQPK